MADSIKKNSAVKSTGARKPLLPLNALQFERLLADIVARFIDLPHEQTNSVINDALGCVGRTLGVDRCSLLEFHEDLSVDPNLFYYNAPGIKPVSAVGPPSPDSYLRKMIREGKEICFSRLTELPQEAMVDLEFLQSRGVKSAFFIPIQIKGRTSAALVLSSIRSEYLWPEKLKPRLRLLAEIFTNVLKQKKTEEMMRNSKENFRQFFKNIPDYAYIISPEGIIQNINYAALRVLGYERHELVGQSLMMVYAPESRPKMEELFDRWNKGTPIHNEEMVIITKSGEKRIVLLNVTEVQDQDGRIMHSPMVQTDISERKRHEETILQEKGFTETVINSLPGIFYLYDSDWRMVRWNRNHELLTGFSTEELKGRMVLDWFSQDYKDIIAATVRKVFDEGEAMVEAPLTIKDRRQVPYFFKGVRLDIAGEAYFLGMGIDISQRKANEDALHQREQQLRLITDSLPARLAHINSNQRYIFANESYAKWVGRPRNDILGKHLPEVIGDDAYKEMRGRIKTVLSGRPVTFETVINSPKSESRHLLTMYVPDYREGNVQGFFASIHDMTELEKAKEQAQVAREALYHVGRVTTLDALSSSLSHEMQQPLTGVLSNAQAVEMMLENPQADMDEIRVIIKDIVADTKRASEVTWHLRALLRKQDTNFQIIHFNDMIEDVLNVLNSDMVIHNIMVERDFAANLPKVMGDSVQLKQVLINLILNAQQVMEDSTSEVLRLVIQTSVGSEGKITVAIEDSGPGIEEGKLEHIFEPFYTTKSEGTGMGLVISRFIIDAHGGQIWAENRAEQGARICFSLPVVGGNPES